jgi:hypothetical protein
MILLGMRADGELFDHDQKASATWFNKRQKMHKEFV